MNKVLIILKMVFNLKIKYFEKFDFFFFIHEN